MTPLTADDVADCIVWAATRPSHVNIDQIVVLPRDQAGARLVHRRPASSRLRSWHPQLAGGGSCPSRRGPTRRGRPGSSRTSRDRSRSPEALRRGARRGAARGTRPPPVRPSAAASGVVDGRSGAGRDLVVRLPSLRELAPQVAVGHRPVPRPDPRAGDLRSRSSGCGRRAPQRSAMAAAVSIALGSVLDTSTAETGRHLEPLGEALGRIDAVVIEAPLGRAGVRVGERHGVPHVGEVAPGITPTVAARSRTSGWHLLEQERVEADGDAGALGHVVHGQQHAGHEARPVVAVVADRRGSGRWCRAAPPGGPPCPRRRTECTRMPAGAAARRGRRAAPRCVVGSGAQSADAAAIRSTVRIAVPDGASILLVVVELDHLGRLEPGCGQLGEAHHQHGADGEVGGDQAVARGERGGEAVEVVVGEARWCRPRRGCRARPRTPGSRGRRRGG